MPRLSFIRQPRRVPVTPPSASTTTSPCRAVLGKRTRHGHNDSGEDSLPQAKKPMLVDDLCQSYKLQLGKSEGTIVKLEEDLQDAKQNVIDAKQNVIDALHERENAHYRGAMWRKEEKELLANVESAQARAEALSKALEREKIARADLQNRNDRLQHDIRVVRGREAALQRSILGYQRRQHQQNMEQTHMGTRFQDGLRGAFLGAVAAFFFRR